MIDINLSCIFTVMRYLGPHNQAVEFDGVNATAFTRVSP